MAERTYPAFRGGDLPAVTAQIARIPVDFAIRKRWWLCIGLALMLMGYGTVAVIVLFDRGVGVWGNDQTVLWGMAIMNYVWWIGIGNAGTMISALFLLLNQRWRNSLNRFAETMTVLAVACAGLYPILHLGRPGFVLYMLPYPNTLGLWPQFRSALFWDVTAVITYLLASLVFWYVGMLPDFAALRDRLRPRRWKVFYGLLALGWRGAGRHWERWWHAYKGAAILAVPLVISVHSGVGLLFASGPQAGWHSTVYPPFFVMGALYSGFGTVILLAVLLRHVFRLDALVTERHLDVLGKLLLATGLMTGYGYVMESYTMWVSGHPAEVQTLMERFTGRYAWTFWITIGCNLILINLLWFRTVRRHPLLLSAMGLVALVGMWFERYMLVLTTLYKPYADAMDARYVPTVWDWGVFAGTVGIFLFGFLLFVRFLPIVSTFEVREAIAEESRGSEERIGEARP